MGTNKIYNKITAFFAMLLFFMVGLILSCSEQGTSLIDLQKEVMVADPENGVQKILLKLDEYYLTMSIPDSIRKQVQADVDTLIMHRASKLDTNVTFRETNVYVLERTLGETLRNVLIAQIINKNSVYKSLLRQCKTMAEIVDAGTNNNYWVPWITKVGSFNPTAANTWLSADRAYNRCYSLCRKNSILSEKYGALGLQLANQITDLRLRSDIVQRLFFILYRLRELYDLSFVFAEREIKATADLKYHLRATGFLFNYAEALYLSGQNRKALETYENIVKRAERLCILGRLNINFQKYDKAFINFEQAIEAYEDNGLLRAALETKCDLVECLIGMSNYQEAKYLLEKILKLATKIHDEQCKINALGKKAEIAAMEGNVDKAIQVSNQLIRNIEGLSTRFTNVDNLIYFRQKIHSYLQNAVIYELKKNRVDSAFIKLDYMKARALKNRKRANNNKNGTKNRYSHVMDIEELKAKLSEKELLINYFVTPDTLYAFVLDRENLQVLKKTINRKELRGLTNAYINSINETIQVFSNRQPSSLIAHYDSVTALGNKLYNSILGWSALSTYLKDVDVTYIIPDDMLYGVPFSSLVVSNENLQQFLIQQTAIINLPSAMLLQSLKNENIMKSEEEKKVLCAIDWRLPGAQNIFNNLKAQFPSVEKLAVNVPDIKKKDVLLKLNQDYDVYIFVGHSVSNTRMPELSFIELSVINQVDSTAKRFAVTFDDLKAINWSHAEKVFLFGCETARGKSYKGSGLAGLQQGIILSGAREVLASLWRIDAYQTKSQVIKFFESLSQYNKSALALQVMQIKTIQDLNNDNYYKRAHPYIWGSYTLLKMAN